MEADLDSVQRESPQTTHVDQINGTFILDACALCQRVVSFDNAAGDLEDINLCGDCKVLLLEELGTPILNNSRRRRARVRRTRARYNSSESLENLFSQQFTNIINSTRQRQRTNHEHDTQSVDTAGGRSVQRTSSRTTPSVSGRWRRALSDTESDGVDSLYGESESNVSFSGYRFFNGESDTISISGYGGESDASVDGHGFMDSDFFTHPGAGSYLDSDTDIDPMHAGVNQWNSDDQDEDDNDNEWEEGDAGGNTAHSLGVRLHRPRILNSSRPTHWHRQFRSPESAGTIYLRIREGRHTYLRDTFANLEESELRNYAGNPNDYLDARGFEELIDNLADTDGSRRGALPAAVSFVRSLPCLVISEDQEKQDGLACAICKDSLTAGTVVNQLPCFHLYHHFCILPWLSARSTCPLCRFELPTDDNDSAQNAPRGLVIQEISQNSIIDDGSSDISDITESDEATEHTRGTTEQGGLVIEDHALECSGGQNLRRRWFFASAAAPIVSFVGIVLVMWLGSPLTERREPIHHDNCVERPNHNLLSGPHSQIENRSRRWWLF